MSTNNPDSESASKIIANGESNHKFEQPTIEKHQNKDLILLKIVAWVSMLMASSLSIIIWRELSGGEPIWWPWMVAIALITILAMSLIINKLKSLRHFLVILIIIYFLGFGGGWQWGLIPFIRDSISWNLWIDSLPWALSAIMTHILRLLPAFVILIYLLLLGRKREDFFLVKGNIKAMVEPSKLIGMKKPEPWTRIGSIFAIIFIIGTLTFLMLTSPPSLTAFINVLPLIPITVIIAAINAFNEEFTLRAAPLSELWSSLGKKQALLITTIYFGLGHYYGVPNGIIGVILSAFLGWFLGKSLLETKGFFWAWFIHFLPDIIIFTFYAMSV